jgi:hypothetical protein
VTDPLIVEPLRQNPLRDPQDRRLPRVPEPCALVVFGITGDLARKKLLPAVYDLHSRGLLPTDFVLVGFARRDWSDGDFEDMAREAARTGARTPWREEVWSRLAGNIRFVPGSFDDDNAFDELAETLDQMRDSRGIKGNAAFYLSIPPSAFPLVLKQLQRTGLADNRKSGGWRRVVVEKPFGTDLESSRELNDLVDDVFTAQDVFRIDHYLGKETVQNILALRFANQLFEPVWNSNYVDSVQITMAEDVGIGTRAGFYDQTGAARDVLQNHVLQLLALVGMEEPVEFTAEAIRTEKVKVLRAISLPDDLEPYAIRGQYTQGWLAGERVAGYRQEKDVPPDSTAETYAALGRGPVLPAHRQAAAAPGHRDLDPVQEGAAPAVLQDRHRGAGPQPAGDPGAAGRGRDPQVRIEGARVADGGARRGDGFPLRACLHRVQPRGVRAADPGRAARRRHAVPAGGRGRGVLAGGRPDGGLLAGPPAGVLPGRRVGTQGGRRDAGARRARLEATVTVHSGTTLGEPPVTATALRTEGMSR